MRQGLAHREIRPAISEAIDRSAFGNIKRIAVFMIDFREGFDQICDVAFIAGKLGSDRMRVYRDMHDRFRSIQRLCFS